MMDEFPNDPEIEFFSESIPFRLKNSKQIADWLDAVIYKEGHRYRQLNFIFCSDEYLLEINKKHLDHHDFTDVITFCLSDEPIEADIFISIDRVKENAFTYSVPFSNELSRVMVHGVLHCLGYDDKTEGSKKQMKTLEAHYLSMLSDV